MGFNSGFKGLRIGSFYSYCFVIELVFYTNCFSLQTMRFASHKQQTIICIIEKVRLSKINQENNQQDALYRLIYYSRSALHVSDDVLAHYQEHLNVFTVSGSVYPSAHNPHSLVSTHPRHQPEATWVNTTRYCKYSQVLLMMGENNVRNMYS